MPLQSKFIERDARSSWTYWQQFRFLGLESNGKTFPSPP
jgi:hypothetical protein